MAYENERADFQLMIEDWVADHSELFPDIRRWEPVAKNVADYVFDELLGANESEDSDVD